MTKIFSNLKISFWKSLNPYGHIINFITYVLILYSINYFYIYLYNKPLNLFDTFITLIHKTNALYIPILFAGSSLVMICQFMYLKLKKHKLNNILCTILEKYLSILETAAGLSITYYVYITPLESLNFTIITYVIIYFETYILKTWLKLKENQ